MAYFFILDADQDDPVHQYRENDIIDVLDLPQGVTQPMPPPYRIVNVTNVTRSQALAWISEHYDADGDTLMRRIYALDPQKMTTAQRNAFINDRYIETTLNAARKWVKNKATGNYEG